MLRVRAHSSYADLRGRDHPPRTWQFSDQPDEAQPVDLNVVELQIEEDCLRMPVNEARAHNRFQNQCGIG